MPKTQETKPVGDSVPKVNNEIAVGADLEFQRWWWKVERATWIVFSILILLDIAGCFGRGPVAKAHIRSDDGTLDVNYERIERLGTPAELTIHFSPDVIHNHEAQLWVSESLVKALGNKRIIPQPEKSVIDQGGISYVFPAAQDRVTVEFSLEPAKVGVSELKLRAANSSLWNAKILVMP